MATATMIRKRMAMGSPLEDSPPRRTRRTQRSKPEEHVVFLRVLGVLPCCGERNSATCAQFRVARDDMAAPSAITARRCLFRRPDAGRRGRSGPEPGGYRG